MKAPGSYMRFLHMLLESWIAAKKVETADLTFALRRAKP
jgi:hypothetical protein